MQVLLEADERERSESDSAFEESEIFTALEHVLHAEHAPCAKPCQCAILCASPTTPYEQKKLDLMDVQRARNRGRRLMLRHEAMIYRLADGVACPSLFPSEVREMHIDDKFMHGLFATRDININEEVAEYGGKLIFEDELREEPTLSAAECATRRARRSCAWAIELSTPVVLLDHYDDVGVLPMQRMDKKLGRFANSPAYRALRSNVRVRITFHKCAQIGAKAFPRGTVGAVYVRVVYVSTRRIAANEEILVDYGAGYSKHYFQ